jgi:tubulin--tyrosine ligase-like protein 12
VCNQYPNEQCVTFKNLLVSTVQRHFGAVSWLPATYDLATQAAQLVADYRTRQEADTDNHWIVKPWNLGRSKVMNALLLGSRPRLVRV